MLNITQTDIAFILLIVAMLIFLMAVLHMVGPSVRKPPKSKHHERRRPINPFTE